MKKKYPVCTDCRCKAIAQNTERYGRQLVMEETTFSCGARQKESFTANGNIGKVEFIGCGCGS